MKTKRNQSPAPATRPLYQEHASYFATVGDGLEDWAAEELRELGATAIQPGYRGLQFGADTRTLYRILYMTRLCSRVLAPLSRFDCHSTKYLYRRVYDIPWETLFDLHQTFAIQAVTVNSTIRHSRHAALVVKDAIADRFRERFGERPNVDARHPDCAIHLYLNRNQAVLNIDLAGGSLHRRGYRAESVDAPMQETLAAAIIHAAKWTGEIPLVDPFCGSGTLLCEAWMKACRIPAGYLRASYGFQRLPDYQDAVWRSVKKECDDAIRIPDTLQVCGSDIDAAAVEASRTNLALLPEGHRVTLSRHDATTGPGWTNTVAVANPPYGVRLGRKSDAEDVLKRYGDFLKQRCAGSTALIYYGDETLVKTLGLKPTWKKALANGGLDGRLCYYELFAGPADQHKARKWAAQADRSPS